MVAFFMGKVVEILYNVLRKKLPQTKTPIRKLGALVTSWAQLVPMIGTKRISTLIRLWQRKRIMVRKKRFVPCEI